jgi:hypothetical protein
MAKQSVNFAERHAEKFVLAVAGAIMVAVVVLFLVRTPNKVDFRGQSVGPDRVDAELRSQAERMRSTLERAQPQEPEPPNYLSQLQEDFDHPLPEGLVQLSPPVWFGALPPKVNVEPTAQPVAVIAPPAPSQPVLATGRSVGVRRPEPRDLPQPGSEAPAIERIAGADEDVFWVTVGATIDMAAARKAYEAGGYSPARSRLQIADVLVRRQQQLAPGTWSGWEPVPLARVYQAPSIPTLHKTPEGLLAAQDQAETEDLARLVDARRALILRQPILPLLAGGDPWQPPSPLPGVENQPWYQELQRVLEGAEPERKGVVWSGDDNRVAFQALKDAEAALEKGDLELAEALANEVADRTAVRFTTRQRARELLLQVQERREELEARPETSPGEGANLEYLWVHDFTVQPGETYRYQIAVRALNPYVGQAEMLRNPEDVTVVAVDGPWSPASEPITVKPSVLFYLVSTSDRGARVDVFRWHLGRWYKHQFRNLLAGDMIGEVQTKPRLDEKGEASPVEIDFSTGALVVDVQEDQTVYERRRSMTGAGFELVPAQTAILTYLDSRGMLRQRTNVEDRSDEQYRRLKDEAV